MRTIQNRYTMADLRPIAERTILQDLEMSSDLKERILSSVQSDPYSATSKNVSWKKRIFIFVSVLITIVVGSIAALELTHLSHNTMKDTIQPFELGLAGTVPSVAISSFLLQKKANPSDAHLNRMSTQSLITAF